MNKMLRLPVALAFALGASNAFALGLGQVQVKSSLNQPLLAEIPVLENAPGEAAELQVKLASAESFARIGLERPSGALLSALQFEIVQGATGSPVIRISTPNRVNDPFLSLLIEAEWGRGKLLREYTLLLDPPVAVPSRQQPSQTAALPQGDVRPAPAEDLATPPPISAPRAAPAAPSLVPGESYGPVTEGDSLWKIASRAIPDSSVNINQMMIALQRANPDAFIGGNINRLRTGAVLRIPSRDEIAAIGAGEAAQAVREQTGDTSLQPVESGGERRQTASSAAPSADSRLAIVPPRGDQPASAAQTGAASGADGRELRADLARAREQSEALNQENRELRTRVQELEKIRGDSERLIELKNSELQALQQRLAELEAQRAAASDASSTPAVTTPVTPAVEAPAEPSDAAPELDAAAPSAGAEAGEADLSAPTDQADAATPVTEPASSAPAAPVTPPASTTPEPTTATPALAEPLPARPPRQEWYENPLILGGGGAVVIGLLALLGLRGRGKKKAAAAAASPSRFDGADFGVPAASAGAAAAAAGYAEDATAVDEDERELLDRVAEQPDDLERHLELVRYYYGANDAARFEGAVEAMYAQVYDPDDQAWQQALQMGREMLPDHPLFMDQSAASQAWEPVEESGSASSYTSPSFAAPAATPAPSYTQDEPEFRIDLAEPELEVPEVERAPELEAPSFSYEPEPAAPAPAAVSSIDSALTPDAIEAAATKLELARAYLDMGDVEGARGMLEEVTQEGTAEQRQDARRLLDEIR